MDGINASTKKPEGRERPDGDACTPARVSRAALRSDRPRRAAGLLLVSLFVSVATGCAVVAVADAAVTVVATGVKVVAKTVGAAVDAVTPDPKPPEK